jgi:hypothetical protein
MYINGGAPRPRIIAPVNTIATRRLLTNASTENERGKNRLWLSDVISRHSDRNTRNTNTDDNAIYVVGA